MNKTAHIQLRVTKDEKELWEAKAFHDDLSLSEWIRQQCGSQPTEEEIQAEVAKTAKCRFGGCARIGRLPCPFCKAKELIEMAKKGR